MLDEEDKDPADFTLSDFDYMISALAYAHSEGLTLEELVEIVSLEEVSTGEEFDKAVDATIRLKELTRGQTNRF